jgi:serine/threonine protein kinase
VIALAVDRARRRAQFRRCGSKQRWNPARAPAFYSFGIREKAAALMAETYKDDAAREVDRAGDADGTPTRASPHSTLPHALLLPKGYEIEEFRIEDALGVGGFGITYLALDKRLQRRVAIKEYMPENLVAGRDPGSQRPIFRGLGDRAQFESFLQRFRDEALHIARFNHANIVPIHRVLARNETAYIVMDYVGETSLARLVASGRRLSEPELAHLLGGILDGLSAMHAAGLLHRDVKPSNIMLRADGTPVLIDFGSVRRAHYDGEPASVRVVSEGFSPPEQYDADGEIGPWSDIFAAAATCYYAMRGEPPAPVVDRVLALMRRRADPLVPLTAETTGGLYSESFLAAVAWGLELRESARPQAVPEWAAAFPPPLQRRTFAAPGPTLAGPSLAAPRPAPAEEEGIAAPTLIADAALPAVRALYQRNRLPDSRPPARNREARMRLLGQLTAFGVLLVGATVGVGVATRQIGPSETERLAEVAPAAAPKVATLSARGTATPPSANAARCDALAAHPDDPGKPAGVSGIAFDGMSEADTREALDACAAAAREDAGNLRAKFNLGRAYQRIARLKPAEGAEAWRRAGDAYADAARRGYAAAQGNFGQMLYGGTGGMAPDPRQAVEWLRKAAGGDFPDAYLTLAFAYTTGRGTDAPDQRKAFCWLSLLERATTVKAYRALAQQQRAAMALSATDKRSIEEGAMKGKDCL